MKTKSGGDEQKFKLLLDAAPFEDVVEVQFKFAGAVFAILQAHGMDAAIVPRHLRKVLIGPTARMHALTPNDLVERPLTDAAVCAVYRVVWGIGLQMAALLKSGGTSVGRTRLRALGSGLQGRGRLQSEAPCIEVDTSIFSLRPVRIFEGLQRERGLPQLLRNDQGLKCLGQADTEWAKEQDMAIQSMQPDPSRHKAFIERFDRSFQEKALEAHLYQHLEDVREATGAWMLEEIEQRPKDSVAI